MPKLTYHCPICEKQLKLKKSFKLGNTTMYEYTCGHVFSKSMESIDTDSLDFTSLDGSGHKARPYQEDGVKFILEADYNCIIADQMRLGKTPQALLSAKNSHKKRLPVLILVKSANLWQWIREYKKWCNSLPNGIYPIIGSGAWIPPGFSAYICSMDTFGRNSECKCGHSYHENGCRNKKCSCKTYVSAGESVRDKLKKIPFKLIIADEAHSFKNTDSNRSQALVDFVAFFNTGESNRQVKFTCNRCKAEWMEVAKQKFDKRIGHTVLSKSSRCPKCQQWCYVQQQHDEREIWQENPEAVEKINKLLALGSAESNDNEHERALALQHAEELKKTYNVQVKEEQKPCGLILLTGTPILNRAEEYFVPLNLINPERFSSLEGFRHEWLEQDSKGRWARVKSYKIDQFKREIAPFYLRREKEDVYKELPALNHIYTVIEPDKDLWAKEYNRILDKLDVKLAEKANPTYWDMQADLMELRRICGMMKLMWTADYLQEAADESNAKYAIGIHHQTVRDVLYVKLGGEANCYKLSGEDSSERKDWIMRNWETSDKQFLIINMLAGGVGMDFHYCDNVLILERQWNAETERQFEFRFYNPDLSIKKNPTTVEYILAKGTFEEQWYNMLEEKKINVDPLVYNNWDLTTDAMSFRDLAERTVASRM